MNFKIIVEEQRKLDVAIEKAHNVVGAEVIDKKILALMVELSEFANEIKPFKYWKRDKSIDKNAVLEEFVDGIHFLLSIGLSLNSSIDIEPEIFANDQTLQVIEIYRALSILSSVKNAENLEKAFALYLGIGELVGITYEQIIEFYIKKNEVNHERIAKKY